VQESGKSVVQPTDQRASEKPFRLHQRRGVATKAISSIETAPSPRGPKKSPPSTCGGGSTVDLGPKFVMDSRHETQHGRTHFVLTRFFQDGELAVMAATTMREIALNPPLGDA
jgi:hypothetical protein